MSLTKTHMMNCADPSCKFCHPKAQENIELLEVRKLLNILQVYGNVLVPSLNGANTYAVERLEHVVNSLQEKGMTMDEIALYVDKLNEGGAA